MNERISILQKQATKEVWGNCSWNGAPEFEGYELDVDLFAKLLIAECAAQCNPVKGIKYSPNSLSSRNECKSAILSYFDIKEGQ